jgi:nicotinate-nucleotide--dimethylbenzimidazole phosphoribosyltransferase
MSLFVIPEIPPFDSALAVAARSHLDRLTKPQGSLGRLEDLATQLCVITGEVPAPIPQHPAIAVFAGDHGVVADGVTHWPSEVTAQMVANFAGGGAAISVLARQMGATLTVVDVGVATPIPNTDGVSDCNVAKGTASLLHGPAMTPEQTAAALQVGVDIAEELIAAGSDLLVTGEMGIGNTTAAAAIICALTDSDPALVTGRGTGVDDETFLRKQQIVAAALNRFPERDALTVLSQVGGYEIAALAGFILAGAAHHVPVLVDGVITLAAALVAVGLNPAAQSAIVGSHRSTEPGATLALEKLGVAPLVDLAMRLGEGSGAALCIPFVQAAAALLSEMATFDAAGVSEID